MTGSRLDWTTWKGRLPEVALLAALVVMQFVDLKIGPDGRPGTWSLYLIGFALVTVVTLPVLVLRHRFSRAGLVGLGCAAVLMVWAVVSAATSPAPRLFLPNVAVSRADMVVPPVTALVTLLAAWGMVTMVRCPAETLRRAALVIALVSVPAAARTMLARDSVRVATGMGGSSAFHVVLLLCLGVLLAPAAGRRTTRLEWCGVAICLVGIILTGSRAGLLCLVALVALVAFGLTARGRARLALALLGVMVVVTGLLAAFVPVVRRLFTLGDYGREANVRTAIGAWQRTDQTMLFGVGSGRMWPWYAFETGHATVPWKGIIHTGFGRGLSNPHSLPLGVLVEQGAVALVLVVVVLALPVAALVRRWRALTRTGGSLGTLLPVAALVASIPALFLDYYWFKNYATSFWWWLVFASLWARAPEASVLVDDPVPAS